MPYPSSVNSYLKIRVFVRRLESDQRFVIQNRLRLCLHCTHLNRILQSKYMGWTRVSALPDASLYIDLERLYSDHVSDMLCTRISTILPSLLTSTQTFNTTTTTTDLYATIGHSFLNSSCSGNKFMMLFGDGCNQHMNTRFSGIQRIMEFPNWIGKLLFNAQTKLG
jgi:hypothetical protein